MKSNQTKFNQYTLFNSLAGMDERSLNWLISTWAFSYRLFIYPLIRPELFDCLYSVVESRPATPPQVLVSLLLIGAIFNKTDDEMHNEMMAGDMRIRFATNTMEIPQEKLPTCDKALSRFRERNRAYAREHNCESPLEVCLREVQFGMWALMGISMKNLRVDSTQISANIARLTREQLLWRANARMLRSLPGMGAKKIEELCALISTDTTIIITITTKEALVKYYQLMIKRGEKLILYISQHFFAVPIVYNENEECGSCRYCTTEQPIHFFSSMQMDGMACPTFLKRP